MNMHKVIVRAVIIAIHILHIVALNQKIKEKNNQREREEANQGSQFHQKDCLFERSKTLNLVEALYKLPNKFMKNKIMLLSNNKIKILCYLKKIKIKIMNKWRMKFVYNLNLNQRYLKNKIKEKIYMT